VAGRRQAIKDFKFSDGTQVSKGNWACVPTKAILGDENFFPEAEKFDGFRFAKHEDIPDGFRTISQPEGPSKFVDASPHYHSWGLGGIIWYVRA